jgi:hypothetical protein
VSVAKRKSGERYKNGRLKGPTSRKARLAYDYGNDVVQRRRALFDAMCIKGGKAADQVFDGIGQLWALDMLDGHGIEDTALRDAGRLFAELYWERYGLTAPRTAQYERASRTTNAYANKTRRDIMFDRMDDNLMPGYAERAAVISTCIDTWFSDHVAEWAKPLIVEELVRRGRLTKREQYDGLDAAIMLPLPEHRWQLNALIRGLCLLVDAGLPARFEQQRRAA